jgi:hypothetical protein
VQVRQTVTATPTPTPTVTVTVTKTVVPVPVSVPRVEEFIGSGVYCGSALHLR